MPQNTILRTLIALGALFAAAALAAILYPSDPPKPGGQMGIKWKLGTVAFGLALVGFVAGALAEKRRMSRPFTVGFLASLWGYVLMVVGLGIADVQFRAWALLIFAFGLPASSLVAAVGSYMGRWAARP
jgi:hypothetical protein